MVIEHDKISDLVELISGLGEIMGACEVVAEAPEDIQFVTKGRNSFSTSLRKILSMLNKMDDNSEEIEYVKQSIKDWLSIFKTEYKSETKILSLKPKYLSKYHAEQLFDDIENWIENIEINLEKPKTVLIQDMKLDDFLPNSLTKNLNKEIMTDLKNGFELLRSGLSNPASMILLRASEGIAEFHYKKITGKNNSKLSWNKKIQDLQENYKIKKSLSNYLHYIRDKRNQAAHPGKQFSQEESERILIHVKELLESIK